MASLLNIGRGLIDHDFIPPYLKGYTLIHHWEADDWTVGNNWVDRVGGLVFQKVGNPTKENGLIRCIAQHYFQLLPDANAAAPNGINMGSLWAVEVEGMIYEPTRVSLQIIVDFGSVTTASHAFTPFMVNGAGIMDFNPKFTGNNSAPLYDNDFDFTPYYGKLVKATIGTKEIDSNTVLPFYVLEGEIHDSPNTLTKAQALFDRNFNTAIIDVGRSKSAYNKDYVYVKSIKIYTKY